MKAPYVVQFCLSLNDWLNKWGKVTTATLNALATVRVSCTGQAFNDTAMRLCCTEMNRDALFCIWGVHKIGQQCGMTYRWNRQDILLSLPRINKLHRIYDVQVFIRFNKCFSPNLIVFAVEKNFRDLSLFIQSRV